MANVSNYYIESRTKLISNKESCIIGNKYRITILTPRLARLEYTPSGKFIDDPTALVINRTFTGNTFTKINIWQHLHQNKYLDI